MESARKKRRSRFFSVFVRMNMSCRKMRGGSNESMEFWSILKEFFINKGPAICSLNISSSVRLWKTWKGQSLTSLRTFMREPTETLQQFMPLTTRSTVRKLMFEQNFKLAWFNAHLGSPGRQTCNRTSWEIKFIAELTFWLRASIKHKTKKELLFNMWRTINYFRSDASEKAVECRVRTSH